VVEEIVGVMAWTNKAKGNTHSNDVDSHFDACRHDIEQRLNSTVGNDIRSGECYNKLAVLDKGNAEILMNYVLPYKHESSTPVNTKHISSLRSFDVRDSGSSRNISSWN
jgi:hypothetical protein